MSAGTKFDSHVSVGMPVGKHKVDEQNTSAYIKVVNQGETRHKEITFNLSWHQLPPRRAIFSRDSLIVEHF